MKETHELNGAWEERGVIGTRVEIENCNGKTGDVTVCWRNAPVLRTTFRLTQDGDRLELDLKARGLRYEHATSDYAQVTSLIYENGTLALTKNFPFSGEDTERLTKTAQSRYGDYTIRDEMLPALKGVWTDEDGWLKMKISGDTLEINDGYRTKIHVMHANRPGEPDGRFYLFDQDPSAYDFRGFARPVYDGEALHTILMVCDGPSIEVTLHKQG